ncbi:threonylcarbamoyl-AMP synthase [Candidatus Gottesmanbacteria bacterium RIFCSPHIGHO2_02_FULL_39_14]|uniref:L-threonylcarbamoyladenylate synthase n=3 Tax=Candidatus Gottesmaniibacteriota TaxID=1752720 RepID=A0A1F5ZXQ6_9BACT|nr:MAG: threonylcarbamoyl-AMP synthase [Candidatus Gottesmanbacteria bacterium RBG_16_38_7b]OGG17230.1 MAG: threonylcarbamoyl-AMP synthase [Candidatus Gottesmanbacteria bacterium RIFCSPHIGHO2_02_FULL_39_14]OGG30895.1 MAG: threonylcarbamoyl-AMP synthase [Candidatus Gottesmanbacteria bacterium RIFCSPLOWO2_02_FULL_38_8]
MKQTEGVNKAVEILNQGGIIIFPTDTAFGIGCRIDDNAAVRRLFRIRKRPLIQAVPVLVNSIKMAENYLLSPLPNNVRRLMNDHWPGGLTIVYFCQTKKIPSLVIGGGNSLGVRWPFHHLISNIIEEVAVPVLGPSANFHGDKTPFQLEDLNQKLVKKVDFVLEGTCKTRQASTVIDCTEIPWRILRQGKSVVSLEKYEL